MKKLIACMLALALMCAAEAMAEIGAQLIVVNCNEYITLREEPSTKAAALDRIPLRATVDEIGDAGNGFLRVSYRGQTGYALSKYLERYRGYRGPEISLTRDQRYNINLFLSNFTEAGFQVNGCYDVNRIDPAMLTEFAIEHCWYNRQNRLEWDDYFNYNNVRLPESQIAPVVEKYFGVNITPSHDLPYTDYRNGYYYWQETGGHTNMGFASQYAVEALGNGYYSVWFGVFGIGENWDNSACYYSAGEASSAYPGYGGVTPYGCAVINTGRSGLDDRSGWTMMRYVLNCDY